MSADEVASGERGAARSRRRSAGPPAKRRPVPAGFHRYGNTGVDRYWTGSTWTTRVPRPDNIGGYVVVGIVLQVLGGFLTTSSASETDNALLLLLGLALVAVGAYLVLVGVIAAGVRLGNSWTDFERDVRNRPTTTNREG